MNDAALPGESLFSPLPEDEEQADATKVLFFYLYNRLGQRGYVAEKLQKATGRNKDDIPDLVSNYIRTKVGSEKSNDIARAARELVFEALRGETKKFPPYLDQLARKAFGDAAWLARDAAEVAPVGDVGALVRSALDPTADLESICKRYHGSYTGFRFSTKGVKKGANEEMRHYVRYRLEIHPYKTGMEVATFSLHYRDRHRTRAGTDGFTTVDGFIVPKSQRLYFFAAEARGRDNLIYIVCHYEPGHTPSDWIRGLIVTQNRDAKMIAARVVFRTATQDRDQEIKNLGVFEVDNTDINTIRLLENVENHTENYILTWYD